MKWLNRFMVWMFGAAYEPKIALEWAESDAKNDFTYDGLPLYENDLETLSRRFSNGELIRHFKRQWDEPTSKKHLYIYLGEATHTETGEVFALYYPIDGPRVIYVRPNLMFHSEVDKAKYPEATQKFRFEKATGHDCLIANNGKGYYVL